MVCVLATYIGHFRLLELSFDVAGYIFVTDTNVFSYSLAISEMDCLYLGNLQMLSLAPIFRSMVSRRFLATISTVCSYMLYVIHCIAIEIHSTNVQVANLYNICG